MKLGVWNDCFFNGGNLDFTTTVSLKRRKKKNQARVHERPLNESCRDTITRVERYAYLRQAILFIMRASIYAMRLIIAHLLIHTCVICVQLRDQLCVHTY